MLRLKDVPEEDMPEVVRVASELYERDREQAAQDQAKQAYVDAAGEVGLPPEYLERASEEVHARRVARVQQLLSESGLPARASFSVRLPRHALLRARPGAVQCPRLPGERAHRAVAVSRRSCEGRVAP